MSREERSTTEVPSLFGEGTSVFGLLVALAGLTGIFMAAIWSVTQMKHAARFDYSAIQVTQLYAQAGFWVLVSIGVMAVGILWVVSTRD